MLTVCSVLAPRSPALSPCEFFLRGYVKDLYFPLPKTIPELKLRVSNPLVLVILDMLQNCRFKHISGLKRRRSTGTLGTGGSMKRLLDPFKSSFSAPPRHPWVPSPCTQWINLRCNLDPLILKLIVFMCNENFKRVITSPMGDAPQFEKHWFIDIDKLHEDDDWDDELPPDIPGSEEEDIKEEEPLLLNEIEEDEEESRNWEEKMLTEEVLGSGAERPKEDGPVSGTEVTVGYCAPYTGQICRRYLNGSGHVYYNFTSENHPIPLNEQITTELWGELVSSLLEPCRTAAEVVLCNYAFPKCEWTDGVARLKPLCREDCIAIKELFCYNEWALVEDNKQRGIFFKSRGHFRLPNCNTLPPLSKGGKETCSNAHLTDMREDEITTDCIRARGRFYQGSMNVTKTGIACQRWDVQEPHHHNRPPKVFPEVLNSENYCRNAGGEEPVPWCYTMDPRVRWQHCDIPLCDRLGKGEGSTAIGKHFNLGESTVRAIKKNEAAIRKSFFFFLLVQKLSTKFASYTRDVLLERTERAIAQFGLRNKFKEGFLSIYITVDGVVGLKGDNDEEEKSTPLTGKLIQGSLQLCSKLENHFLINDPNSEGASKLQRELQNCMSGYRELYKKIKESSSQSLITDYIVEKEELHRTRMKFVKIRGFYRKYLLKTVSSDDEGDLEPLRKRFKLLSDSDND
ncbi:tyrosine-protein kinase transmembrane receptor Ror2 [Trichonephila clavipes]|nr:tyrosine-protein kinase transmembrane receptor Ror2 [Trichonephila clavipes]